MNNDLKQDKYKNLTDLELDYKVKNQRLFINATFFVIYFILFFIIGIKGYIFIENMDTGTALSGIIIVGLSVGLLVLAIGLDIISKKIVLPSEAEQKRRIADYGRQSGGNNYQFPMESQEFIVNKIKKKKVSYKIITATIGGKLAVTLILVLALTAIILPMYVHFNKEYITNVYNEHKQAQMLHNYIPALYPEETGQSVKIFIFGLFTFVHPLIISLVFLIFTFVAVACTLRQRGRETRMRINEKLELNNNTLIYSFSMAPNRWYPQNGITMVAIDLLHSKILYDKRQDKLIFQGNIETKLIENGENPKSVAQMILYPIDPVTNPNSDGTVPSYVPNGTSKNNYFEIHNYFDPDIAKLLSLK